MAPINAREVTEREVVEGDIAFRRRRLGAAAGARRIGLSHYIVPPGARQMPVYGTVVPGDSVYYPEAGKVTLRGLGVTLDVPRQR